MKKHLTLSILFIASRIFSQDIQGSYIRTGWIAANTYSIGITLYCDASLNIARPTLSVSFGDNTTGSFSLSTTSTIGTTNIKTYIATHTYPGAGVYQVTYLDTYRISGIRNMLNSQTQQIGMASLINVSTMATAVTAPSVSFLPVNLTVVNNTLSYNPGCTANGDSLSYMLDNCMGAAYYKPGGSSLNNTNGLFVFSNDTTGKYAFLLTIKQWRKNSSSNQYFQVGTSQMDFIVEVTGTVGLSENQQDNFLSAYPNPFTDKLILDFSKSNSSPLVIRIFDCVGKQIHESDQLAMHQEIDLSYLSRGIYFLSIENKEGVKKAMQVVKE